MVRPGGAGEAVAPRDGPAAGEGLSASRRLLLEQLRRKPPSDKDVSALRHTRAVPVTALAALRDNVKLLTSQVCDLAVSLAPSLTQLRVSTATEPHTHTHRDTHTHTHTHTHTQVRLLQDRMAEAEDAFVEGEGRGGVDGAAEQLRIRLQLKELQAEMYGVAGM